MDEQIRKARYSLIDAAGRTTQGFGVGRIIGQVYALLYLSPEPLSLDELVAGLGVSKASVSTNVRELLKWSAVRKVWIAGSRKDYYEAEPDFFRIIQGGVLPFVSRKLESSLVEIEEAGAFLGEACSDGTPEVIFFRRRLGEMKNARERLALLFTLFNSVSR